MLYFVSIFPEKASAKFVGFQFHVCRCRTPVENALRDAKLSISDVQEVILVGGSTRIPAVQELVKRMTGKDPNVTVNPDEVVALGAAVQVISFYMVGVSMVNLLLFCSTL